VGGDLNVAVVGTQPPCDRLGILAPAMLRRLLEREQVEASKILLAVDRLEDLVQLDAQVEVPGAELESRGRGATYAVKAS
jgi:hypothetical protein